MTEEMLWKVVGVAGIIIGYLIKILIDFLRKEDKHKIYVCPLDKSGLDSKMNHIALDIDKAEVKLNDIKTNVGYNQKIIEFINSHYEKISDALNNLVSLQKETIRQNDRQNDLLERIAKNGK